MCLHHPWPPSLSRERLPTPSTGPRSFTYKQYDLRVFWRLWPQVKYKLRLELFYRDILGFQKKGNAVPNKVWPRTGYLGESGGKTRIPRPECCEMSTCSGNLIPCITQATTADFSSWSAPEIGQGGQGPPFPIPPVWCSRPSQRPPVPLHAAPLPPLPPLVLLTVDSAGQ